MPKPSEYLHIRAWHALTGSHEYYIKDLQDRAAQENAPINATYFGSSIQYPKSARWYTIEDCSNLEMRKAVEDWILKSS